MSKYLKKVDIDILNLDERAVSVYRDSTISFYQDGDIYYMHDICNAARCPISNLTKIGTLAEVEEFLMDLHE